MHAGVVTVSPSGVAPVCYGRQLELMCTMSVTGMFLQWSLEVIQHPRASHVQLFHLFQQMKQCHI